MRKQRKTIPDMVENTEPEFSEEISDEELSPEEELPEAELEEGEAEADVAALSAELNSARDQLLRTAADFDNYRKRVMREQERMRQTAAESLMRDLLPVLDNLERALEHAGNGDGISKGVELILTQFRGVLERHGLKPIPAKGEVFDPNVHEAVMQEASAEIPAGHVAQEYQKGYWLGDRVLRPSKVSVSKGNPEAAGTDGKEI
jgi:molecular chaperone GrpE